MPLHTFTFISPKNDNLKAIGGNRTFSHDVTAAIFGVKKQPNGGHVGVPNQSCGS